MGYVNLIIDMSLMNKSNHNLRPFLIIN